MVVSPRSSVVLVLSVVAAAAGIACASPPVAMDEGDSGDTAAGETLGETGASDDGGDGDGDLYWEPATVYPTPEEAGPRGLLDRRGLIHAHSVYSHDACDEMPLDAMGQINQSCFDDFRVGMCGVQHDFIMLTDHRESYTDFEYPEVLLYRPDLGDELIQRGGVGAANRASCGEEARPVLLMAGCESSEMMPVGIEGHVAPTPSERSSIVGNATPANADLLRQNGAVILLAHTEGYTPQDLIDLPIDGFEAFNVHANLFANFGAGLQLLELLDTPERLPHPDLVIAAVFSEEPTYIDTWGTTLARGARRVVTMGTDVHQNTFPQELPDGERVDSYRRLMKWFSNHILVEPATDGTWTDADLKTALAAGRLFGVFEYLGYAQGFDAHVTAGSQTHEIGEMVVLADDPQLHVTAPTVQRLDPELDAPEIEIRVLRAIEGGWDPVMSAEGQLDLALDEAGVYRVEIRMVPLHLRDWLGPEYTDLADADFPWIYANPFYVQ